MGTLGDWGKKIRNFADKTIGTPITNAVKGVKQAAGIEQTPVPDAAKPQLDPGKVAGLAQYGQIVQRRAGAAQDPGNLSYGTYRPQGVARPTMQASRLNEREISAPGSSAMTGAQVGAVSKIQTPAQKETQSNLVLSQEGGNVVNLARPGEIQADTGDYQTAVRGALAERAKPLTMTEGFDPQLRAKAVQLATSGIAKQKEAALNQLREQQMAAGNFGSSVGQKQMADLQAEYDRRASDAEASVDVKNLEAARDDRYRNEGVNSGRLSQIGNLAGTGQNMTLQGAAFGREGRMQNNAATMAEAGFNQGSRSIDRNSAITLANYGREGRNIDYGRSVDENQRQFQNTLASQQYGRSGEAQDFGQIMTAEQFNRGGRQITNADDMARNAEMTRRAEADAAAENEARRYNIEGAAKTNDSAYGRYRDTLGDLAGYSSGNMFTPESQAAADQWNKQEDARAQRLGTVVSTAAKFIKPNQRTAEVSQMDSAHGLGTRKTSPLVQKKGARR